MNERLFRLRANTINECERVLVRARQRVKYHFTSKFYKETKTNGSDDASGGSERHFIAKDVLPVTCRTENGWQKRSLQQIRYDCGDATPISTSFLLKFERLQEERK